MSTRSASVRVSFATWLLFICAWLTLACHPQAKGLGEGPPTIDGNTQLLAVFDPAALSGPAATGLDLDASVAGPPQPPEPPPLPAPVVVDYGPTGEASEYPTVQVRFNRPMVAFGEKHRVSAEEAGFSFKPPIPGEAYWAEPTRLVFEPSEALALATEYEVSIVRKITALDGPEIDVDLHFGFATQAPSVSLRTDYAAAMHGSNDHHWKAKVAVETTHEISLTELRKHVSAKARDTAGDLVPVDIRVTAVKRDQYGYRYPDFWIAPVTRWPADSEVIVTIDKELRGKVGPRPVGYPTVHSFRTPAGVEALHRTCVEGEYEDGCELGPVVVSFSAPVSRAQAKYLSISPKPKGFDTLAVDREYDDDGRELNAYRGVMLWGDFQRGQHYEITVDERIRDVHGQPLVSEQRFEVEFIEPPASLVLERSWGTFTTALGAKLGIESRHVEGLKVRVALLDDEAHERLLGAEKLSWPSGLKPSKEQTIALAHTGKFGWSSHELDLAQFTNGAPATVLVSVGADSMLARAQGRRTPATQLGLVQITDLGITAVGSLPGGRVRVARLRDDKPVAGAEVELIRTPGGERVTLGKTDQSGLIALPSATELSEDALLRARKGDDHVVLPIESLWHGPEPEGSALRLGESVRATVMTERPLYKPGERVRVMGWSTIATPYELSGLRPLPSKTKIEIELRDFRDEVVATATVRAKDHGKFWATLKVPETAALGHYTVTAKLLDSSFPAELQVKDYPVPAFEVSAEADKTDIHGGESTTIRVNASYYFGGRVPITRIRHTNDCRDVNYRPPGLEPGYRVAPHYDAWRGYGRRGRPNIGMTPPPSAAQGHVEYDISLSTGHDGQTNQCTHSVAIADISEQEIGAESTIWVHPEFYLAADTPRMLDHGDGADVAIRTLDFDGQPLAVADVEVTLTRTWSEPEYVTEGGKQRFAGWRSRTKTLAPCKTSSDGAATCSFAKLEHGSYEVVIKAKHGDYEPTIIDWMWVAPPRNNYWPSKPVHRLSVEVNQAKPLVGQTLEAQVRAPWKDGGGLLLLAKGGLHELKTFTLDQGQATVSLEVSDAWIPGATIHVLAIEPGTSTSTPKLQTSRTSVSVGQESRALAVSVRVQAEAQTREVVPIEIEVRDHLGKPARGHVSVWAVDEAVLSLAPLVLPDFVGAFVVGFNGALDIVSGYTSLLLPFVARPDPYSPRAFINDWASGGLGLYGVGAGGGGTGAGYGRGSGAGFGGAGGAGMPQTRNKFESAPIFIADAELDERGIAKLEGELPDNLTTFRLTAVASAPLAAGGVEARFGTGDARVRVTRPMVVRAAMPRIMRPGDLAEIGVIVDNLRGGAGTIDVEFEIHDGKGIIELLDPPKTNASIAAGGQLRLPFRVKALTTGTPEIEVKALMRPRGASGQTEQIGGQVLGDALRLPLPVEPERTLTDRVAVYGSLADDGAALLPFVIPDDADPKFGGLSVSVGSTLLGGVEDAVAYLVQYPYGCVEQTSSSLLPLIPLGRLAKDYPLGIDDVDQYVAAGITRLRSMQLKDGGFSYWPGGAEPAPFASGYATWVLGRAAAAGYPVPPAMLSNADRYLLGVIANWETVTGPTLGEDVEIAMMLSALAERGSAPASAIDILYSRRRRLPVFSQAMLLLALEAQNQSQGRVDSRIAELLGELESVVDEREAVAKVEVTQRWTWYWDSSTRSSALVLMAMLRADPEHPLASKLTRGLLEARRGGRWANTQENAYALIALADYAAIYEAEDPRFDGRVWLGNTAVASINVQGRAFEFQDAFTPMVDLLAAADQADDRLILERAGQGRMYYRVGLEWASTAADKPAKAEGITLKRSLRGEQGTLAPDQAVASGDLLAIDVEIEIPAALDHVAIEIPLPAGLEAVDLELGKGGKAMKLFGQRGSWVSHQELRRDRAVLFADHLQPGIHHTTVFLRATTPGEYLMPAGHAEMMYYPEVYGRTTARRLVVR